MLIMGLMVMIMICSKCGKEVNPNAQFCPHCGTKIEVTKVAKDAKIGKPASQPQDAKINKSASPQKEDTQDDKSKNSFFKTFLLAFGTIAAVIVVGFFAWFITDLFKGDKYVGNWMLVDNKHHMSVIATITKEKDVYNLELVKQKYNRNPVCINEAAHRYNIEYIWGGNCQSEKVVLVEQGGKLKEKIGNKIDDKFFIEYDSSKDVLKIGTTPVEKYNQTKLDNFKKASAKHFYDYEQEDNKHIDKIIFKDGKPQKVASKKDSLVLYKTEERETPKTQAEYAAEQAEKQRLGMAILGALLNPRVITGGGANTWDQFHNQQQQQQNDWWYHKHILKDGTYR